MLNIVPFGVTVLEQRRFFKVFPYISPRKKLAHEAGPYITRGTSFDQT